MLYSIVIFNCKTTAQVTVEITASQILKKYRQMMIEHINLPVNKIYRSFTILQGSIEKREFFDESAKMQNYASLHFHYF